MPAGTEEYTLARAVHNQCMQAGQEGTGRCPDVADETRVSARPGVVAEDRDPRSEVVARCMASLREGLDERSERRACVLILATVMQQVANPYQ